MLLSLFLDWGGQANSVANYPSDPGQLVYVVTTCKQAAIPAGPHCDSFIADQQAANHRDQQRQLAAAELSLAGRSASGVGRFAAGLTASLVGAATLLLIGAGHIGGEFTGRSVKSILVEDPRRWRFLLAKAASLWLTGVVLMLATWAALALASVKLSSRYANPRLHATTGQLLGTSLDQAGRALLVLAVFTLLSLLAAVLTRNTLGTLGVSLGVVLASLALTQTASTARWNLAYPITGWMRFQSGDTPADYLWLVSTPGHVSAPGQVMGLCVLLAVVAALGAGAVGWFTRADVRS